MINKIINYISFKSFFIFLIIWLLTIYTLRTMTIPLVFKDIVLSEKYSSYTNYNTEFIYDYLYEIKKINNEKLLELLMKENKNKDIKKVKKIVLIYNDFKNISNTTYKKTEFKTINNTILIKDDNEYLKISYGDTFKHYLENETEINNDEETMILRLDEKIVIPRFEVNEKVRYHPIYSLFSFVDNKEVYRLEDLFNVLKNEMDMFVGISISMRHYGVNEQELIYEERMRDKYNIIMVKRFMEKDEEYDFQKYVQSSIEVYDTLKELSPKYFKLKKEGLIN